MDFLTAWDITLLELGFASFLLLLAQSWVQGFQQRKSISPDFPLLSACSTETKTILAPTRSIKKMLQQTGKRCIIFYGSQTGTAEKYAIRLAKDANARFNLHCLVADLDDYDFDDLNTLETDQFAIFILATYGEGEPTDNAIAFDNWLKFRERRSSISATDQKPLQLQYAAFGLGNSSYQCYNSMIRRVDSVLSMCGATRIGHLGIGDDGKKTMEEDFAAWRLETLEAAALHYCLKEREYEFNADFQVTETKVATAADVFHGEPNKLRLRNKTEGPFSSKNPLPARIVAARELFMSSERNCLHVEFDVESTSLNYETGDHLAIWPVNANAEVDRFLEVFGLSAKRRTALNIESNDLSLKVPIPALTTYEAAARYYLDIGAPVSRQFLANMTRFVADRSAQAALVRLSTDPTAFKLEISGPRLNLAQALSMIASGGAFQAIPFSMLLENVAKLQPRYYSISSSALVARKRISITAVVDSVRYPDLGHTFKGVNTNYLLALKSDFAGNPSGTHQTSGPRELFTSPTALIHVRKSRFRLPRSSPVPVIMIGPGTGVAPFRAFVQERAFIASLGKEVGRTMLFYGCRRSDEDFLYKEEWKEYQGIFPHGTFSLHTAFSREIAAKKVYVQDLLHDHAAELADLILQRGAHVYVCGDASRMAKDVFRAVSSIVDDKCERLYNQPGEEYLRSMKSVGRWSEDVW